MSELEFIGDEGTDWTDQPRALSESEREQIESIGRLEAIKLHRQLTQSTLAAAMREVDAIHGERDALEKMARELNDHTCSSHPCPPLSERTS